MKVRFGDRYIERPALELLIEAIGAPLLLFVIWLELRRGWGH